MAMTVNEASAFTHNIRPVNPQILMFICLTEGKPT